ncbi:four helix bundle protein [Aquirufa ecclesiirivi]|uniref:Four helix bundle protein n=1 Tax=Aquirufa ecclesiirivi TaxID=2715124 RepID=A0ABT4JER2_9BACT|nr:four helix bundle protein [Aquirufa ecclesiirivi]MCZ2474627.1 four helix bundle protein [Aquirufa ecclesiirivi]NHC49546.1 four helix bundle protein [Aquirufa ecclesiirivi]
MKHKNVIKSKSFFFAIQIWHLYHYLVYEKKEFVLSKQILRSGTAVGAIIREAEHAESKLDFKHKMSIAQKEINETIYWLELLNEISYIEDVRFVKLMSDSDEILRIISKIIITVKHNLSIK